MINAYLAKVTSIGCLGGRRSPPFYTFNKEVSVRKVNEMIKALISFWIWIAIVLSSFFMAVLAAISSTIPKPVVIVFAIVVFALSLAVPVINPGIFIKRYTTATGGGWN